jgi:16S rRNA C1402 N4-methylase RsmH
MFDFSGFIQAALEILITTLLPIILGSVAAYVGFHFKRLIDLRLSAEQLAYAQELIKRLVMAAEQAGLIGMIEDFGEAKKQMVVSMADKKLREQGIALDFEVLEALIEGVVYEVFHDEEKEEEVAEAE